MKTNVYFLFVVSAALLGAALGASVTSTIVATANNALFANNRTCGACKMMAVSDPSTASLFKFDLSTLPSDADITSVSLTLSIAGTGSGTPVIDIHATSGPWVQSIVTGAALSGDIALNGDPTYDFQSFPNTEWASPAGVSGSYLFRSQVSDNNPGSLNLNGLTNAALLTLVRGWFTTPANNNGFSVIVSSGSVGTIFIGARNNDNTALRPTLSLTYNTVQGAPPPPTAVENYNPPRYGYIGIGSRVPSRYRYTSSTTGGIVGGVIGGVAFLIIFIAVITIILKD